MMLKNSKFIFMHLASDADLHQLPTSISQKPAIQYFIIFLLLISAFGIRLYHISSPPLDFSPIRQYQNAHIARGIYYEMNESIPESKRQIAKLNMQRMGFLLEPRIIENAAVLGYRIAGAEHLWIPRVISSIFWIAGGIFLFLIARKISSFGPATFSLFFYLFLPYSISSSRSFQPDPMMVMMMLASIYMVLIYFDKPSILRFIAASAVSSIAILIKPYCLFPIWVLFIIISIYNRGLRRSIFSVSVPVFIVISFVPAFFQYVYGMFTNTGFLQEHTQGSFLPHLILSLSFWRGWLVMIGSVTGYLAFIVAGAGLITARKGMPKAVLTGLWLGYLLFGLSATYQMHTHSYYHMPFIPIAALSFGTIGAKAISFVTKLLYKRWRSSVVIFFILVASAVGASEILKNMLAEHKKELIFTASVMGINPELKEYITGNYEKELKLAKEIGEQVGHSTRTVFLTPRFGRVLAYYGELSGLPWPTSRSLYGRKLRGARIPDISQDFTSHYIMIGFHGKYIKYTPDYFIITDFKEYEKQNELREYLTSNFPLLVKNDDYMIFDLRQLSE
jgi:4-amino-4-deoxy-L-arabinose transferase-like glycosyltransferase